MTAEDIPKFPSRPRPYTKKEGEKIFAARKIELAQLLARIEKGSFKVKNERGEFYVSVGTRSL